MKFARFFILLCMILFFNLAHSQTREIDSLVKLKNSMKDDSNKVLLMNELSSMYVYSSNGAMAIATATEAIQLSKKLNYKKGMARAYGNIGTAERIRGHYTEAVKNFLIYLKLKEEAGDKRGVALAYNNLGIVYWSQTNYDEAIKNLREALKIREELGLKDDIAGSYNNIGLVYYQQEKFEPALQNFNKALQIMPDNNKRLKAALYTNVANIYQEQNKLSEALLYYTFSHDLKDPNDPAGNQHFNEQRGHILLKQKKYAEAKKMMLLALQQALALQDREHISFAYDILQKIAKETKDFKSAYEYRETWDKYRDSILNRDNLAKTMALKNQFDLDKKNTADSLKMEAQKQFDAMRYAQAIQKQRMYTWGGLIAFIFMVLVAAVLIRSNLQRRKANQIISKQKHLVEEKQKEIVDSIKYAHRIQSTLLPSDRFMQRNMERMKGKENEKG